MGTRTARHLQRQLIVHRLLTSDEDAPNLLMKVPRKRIQAGRGSAFKLASRVGCVVLIGNKKPCSPFGKQGWKISGSLN